MTSLPYGGATDPNSGHAGSETSRAATTDQDASGATSRQQREVLRYARAQGSAGVTVGGVRLYTGYHHGTASRTLSDLHAAGLLCRLTDVRGRSKVYVGPEWVNGREIEPQGRTATVQLLDDMADVLNRWTERLSGGRSCWAHATPVDGCLRCDTKDALDRYDKRRHR